MLIPSGEGEGMVNSQLVTQGNFNSPSRGLAVVVKKRIPTTRGSASRGRNLFFTTPAKPWLGELKLPFVTRWEFIIPTTRGFATRGRNYTIPSPPPEGITSFILEGNDIIWNAQCFPPQIQRADLTTVHGHAVTLVFLKLFISSSIWKLNLFFWQTLGPHALFTVCEHWNHAGFWYWHGTDMQGVMHWITYTAFPSPQLV